MKTIAYHIRSNDTETTPAWMRILSTCVPGEQDSGRVNYAATVEEGRVAELEAALDADADVLDYSIEAE